MYSDRYMLKSIMSTKLLSLSLLIIFTIFAHCLNGNDTNNNIDDMSPTRENSTTEQSEVIDMLKLYPNLKYMNLTTPKSVSSLRQVLLVHRHGDRTPISFSEKDPVRDEPFWKLHGLGQLTNRGKARVHLLGALIRHRYDEFLGESVNKNERISRSSGSLRCIESAQMFLSSFLALDLESSHDAQKLVWDDNKLGTIWQPASIQTTASSIDGLLAESSKCNKLEAEYLKINTTKQAKQLLVDYHHEVDIIQKHYGFEIDQFYKWFWASSFIEVEQTYFKSKLPQEILNCFDTIQEAGNKALVLYQSSFIARKLRGGLLIDDMLRHMTMMTKGQSEKKFIHYSAHDITIIILLGMFEKFDKIGVRPDYASSLLLELHEDPKGYYFVKIFYLHQVPGNLQEIELEGCEKNENGQCSLESFARYLDKYRVPSWFDWMKECKNDISQADPYQVSG